MKIAHQFIGGNEIHINTQVPKGTNEKDVFEMTRIVWEHQGAQQGKPPQDHC